MTAAWGDALEHGAGVPRTLGVLPIAQTRGALLLRAAVRDWQMTDQEKSNQTRVTEVFYAVRAKLNAKAPPTPPRST